MKEKEKRIELELNRERIRGKERMSLTKREREKEKREKFEVRDSYTSESYSDDNSIGSLLLKSHWKRQYRENVAMEEKRKKSVANQNELVILAKKSVSIRKRCHRLEFVSFSNTKGSDWYRRKTNRFRKGYKDTKKGTSEDKVDGNLD